MRNPKRALSFLNVGGERRKFRSDVIDIDAFSVLEPADDCIGNRS
jgi:hypothetical protein